MKIKLSEIGPLQAWRNLGAIAFNCQHAAPPGYEP